MHVCFIPYGKRSSVELLLREMEAQKHLMKLTKDGQEKFQWIQGVVRVLPGGIYEYIFPKEDADAVMYTLAFDQNPYGLGGVELAMVKKVLKLEKIPEYKKEKKYPWIIQDVSIIPLGVKYDGVLKEEAGDYPGWEHERL